MALFLGAGASVFMGYPTTKDLLKELHNKWDNSNDQSKLQKFANDLLQSSDFTDIEVLYQCIDDLLKFQTFPSSIVAKKIQYPLHGGAIEWSGMVKVLQSLKSNIRDIVLQSFKIDPQYIQQAYELYDLLFSRMPSVSEVPQIITTNYDLIIEEYCGYANKEYINGFTRRTSPPKGIWSNDWNSKSQNSIHYIKLHGSINWQDEDNNGKIVELGASGARNSKQDIMIMPTLGKKDYGRMPFCQLLERFESVLKEVNLLVVIGFSYRDEKLNEIIKKELKEKLILLSISPTSSSDIHRIGSNPDVIQFKNASISMSDAIPKSRIYVYDTTFGPDTINDICVILEMMYDTILQINEAKTSH